jgi:hypothetical protein
MRIAKCAAMLAVLPMLTAASEPIHLQPSSKWVVDYADDSCRLLRTFGTPDDRTVLVMEKASPDSAMSMLVTSKALRTTMGARDFTARFLPHEHVKALSGQGATVDGKDKTPAVLWSSVTFDQTYGPGDKLPPEIEAAIEKAKARMKTGEPPEPRDADKMQARRLEAMSNAAKVTGIEISRRGSKTIVLDTGTMGTAVNMMRNCARNQLTHWGVDPTVEDKIVRPVEAVDQMRWFSARDYPEESLRDAKESVIQVRAIIDANGAVTNCTPLTRVSAPEFPKRVCEIMTARAKFRPAELADGTHVPSYYIQTIQFRMGR